MHHHEARRTASVGPGLILDHDDDDDSSLTDDSPHQERQRQAELSSSRIRPDTVNGSRRRVSMDYHHLRRNDTGFPSWGMQDVPSPPYSPGLPPTSISHALSASSQGGQGHERAQSMSLASAHSAPFARRPDQRSRRESWASTSTATGGSGSASSNLSIHRQESRVTMRSSLDSPGELGCLFCINLWHKQERKIFSFGAILWGLSRLSSKETAGKALTPVPSSFTLPEVFILTNSFHYSPSIAMR